MDAQTIQYLHSKWIVRLCGMRKTVQTNSRTAVYAYLMFVAFAQNHI